MWNHLIRFVRVAVASASLFALSPAQAAVYAGAWDPPFGSPPLTNLNWSGTFAVDTNCPPGSSGTALVPGGACGGVTVLSATVRLLGAAGAIPSEGPIDVTLNFNLADLNSQLDTVTKLIWSNNTILQLQTGLSEWIPLAGTAYEFALQFVIDGDVAITNPVQPPGSLPTSYSGPILFARSPTGEAAGRSGGGADVRILRANVEDDRYAPVFTGLTREGAAVPVPEPGSLALIAGALLAAGWSRRQPRR